jgi:hypothetical protein
LSSAIGRSMDGIIGGEFIRQFVVELDYGARRLTLHQPACTAARARRFPSSSSTACTRRLRPP